MDARLERLVEWEEMWDGMTPESAALLGVMVLVVETAGRPVVPSRPKNKILDSLSQFLNALGTGNV